MSTIYLSLNQPITTKYLKKGSGEIDIEQLEEDVEQLKSDVSDLQTSDSAQNTAITDLQTSDTAQNTAITNLQTNISTHTTQITNLQTSDTAQNAYIDKMRHEIILLSGYGTDGARKEDTKTPMVYVVEKNMDRGNNSEISTTFCAKYVHVNDVATSSNMTLKFGSPNNIATDTEYYYYTCPEPELNGFYIVNGFGEDVLNNHIVKINDVPSNQNYILLKDLMRLYGTSYYQQHYNDVFHFDYLPTTGAKILNLSEWLKTYYTSSDFESMTNLKSWVESKIPSTPTPATVIKCPVDMYINSVVGDSSFVASHQVPFRISSTDYKLPGSACTSTGYYVAFHSKPYEYNHINQITIISILQGKNFPTWTHDSLCKIYKVDCPIDATNINKYGNLVFMMSDGSICYTDYCKNGFRDNSSPQEVHILVNDNIYVFDQLKNNICKISNAEIENSTYLYTATTTTGYGYILFYGSEGTMTGDDELVPNN